MKKDNGYKEHLLDMIANTKLEIDLTHFKVLTLNTKKDNNKLYDMNILDEDIDYTDTIISNIDFILRNDILTYRMFNLYNISTKK